MIVASRHIITQDIRAYGEDDLAEIINNLSDEELNEIGRLASKHIGNGGYISKQVVLGAIEFFEGKVREPKRKKRKLSVYDNKENKPEENLIERGLKAIFKGTKSNQ
jgi:hypothetical protein